MSKVILAGNSVTAEILADYIQCDARYELLATTVDDRFIGSSLLPEVRDVALSELPSRFDIDGVSIIMAVGYNDLNRVREDMFSRIRSLGFRIATYIHPDARIYTNLPLGEGSVVMPGAVIEPHARVGANTIVWSNVTVAHHSSVANHCWLGAGAVISGQAKVQHNTFLGVNCTVVNDVTVGEFNIVGAGAMISRDTKPYSVHLARSAEPFRFSSEDYVKHFGI
jgi:sugar O-acyltransferase (sialic acid O-acetyltransferase NeuD family)